MGWRIVLSKQSEGLGPVQSLPNGIFVGADPILERCLSLAAIRAAWIDPTKALGME